MSKRGPSAHAQNAADRAAIRAAGPVQFLIDAMQGKPAARRDAAGRIIGWEDPLDYEKRAQIGQGLAKKILPDLSAQNIDFKASTDGVLKIVLGDIPAPASIDDAKDVTPAPEQIEAQTPVPTPQAAQEPAEPQPAPEHNQPFPDELQQRVRTRKRRPQS